MEADYYYTLGDTSSTLQETFKTPSGVPITISAASLYLRHQETDTLVGPKAMDVSAGGGVARYTFLAADLALAGEWDYQCKATPTGGGILHIPSDPFGWKQLRAGPAIEA